MSDHVSIKDFIDSCIASGPVTKDEYCRMQKARLEAAILLSEQARVCLDEAYVAIKQELQRLEALGHLERMKDMTVETVIKCDRCGKRLEVEPKEKAFRLSEYSDSAQSGQWDLCTNCRSAVRACIEHHDGPQGAY